jgi:hypothetical protein
VVSGHWAVADGARKASRARVRSFIGVYLPVGRKIGTYIGTYSVGRVVT